MLGDDPPYLSVGTEVSAKYKGAFCEAKIRKVVRSVKCRVTYKQGLGTATVADDQIKGTLRVGALVEAKHGDKKEFVEATITKIQDCSQYTVVFDDGDITTLRRTALCLKSGRHFAESETLDQLPLTHPEHFGNPVIGGRRGRRSRQAQDESSEDEDSPAGGNRDSGSSGSGKEGMETEPEIGRVVCVELGDKKKKDNWFPGLVVAPTAQDTVRIRVRDDYLVRSFKDARYYTVPKKEATEFTKDLVNKVESSTLKVAVEKALLFLEKNELPPHWDRDSLFGNSVSSGNSDSDGELDSDSSDDEPREEKDHFVAQLYKFMDDRGTPINNCPMIGSEDIDLYRLFRAVYKLGGYNRVTNQNQWKSITRRLSFTMQNSPSTHNLVKQAYKKFLHSFEDFYRKLGCTMVNHPRSGNRKQRPGRSLIRDKDRNTPVPPQVQSQKTEKDEDEKKTVEEEKKEKKDTKKSEQSKEEDSTKTMKKKEDPEESVSGHESDVNVEAETSESSSSEKSQKVGTQLATFPNRVKSKAKEETKKKPMEKKKNDVKKQQDKKDEKTKEDETAKTRSKSKDDSAKSKSLETRDTRTPSREAERKTLTKQRRLTDEELKKRGRKRKEYEVEKSRVDDQTMETATATVAAAPSYKGPVELGDRLKVYYGPTHESKVTYEAKVVDMEKDGAEPMFLVHYTGWNTRYDEWIKASRIAQNFTQTQGRVKRIKTTPRPQTPGTSSPANGNKASKPTGNTNTNASQSRRRAQSVVPLTSTASSTSSKDLKKDEREKEKETPQPIRSTTPLSVASSSSRTKSPATPASRQTRITRNADFNNVEHRRRTRRTSGHTDISVASETEDSEAYESDSTEQEQTRTRSRGVEEKKRREARCKAEDRIKQEDVSEGEDDKDSVEDPRRGRRLRRTLGKSQGIKSEPDSDEEQPKGRDFDLNQIRSELKGFDKAVKLELVRVEPDPEESVTDDKENLVAMITPKLDKNIESPKVEPVTEAKIVDKTEDIYEFKEPEPFEFEVRNKRDSLGDKDKTKKRMFDEEPKSPKKKQKSIAPSCSSTLLSSSSSSSSSSTVSSPSSSASSSSSSSSLSVIKESKIETDGDVRKKAKKLFGKKIDDTMETTLPINKLPQAATSACEEAFDRLCESPSFTSMKSTISEETSKVQNNNLDLLFSDLPGDDDGTRDDSEDRLIISETEVSEAEQENINVFAYQQEISPITDAPSTVELLKDSAISRVECNKEESKSTVQIKKEPSTISAKTNSSTEQKKNVKSSSESRTPSEQIPTETKSFDNKLLDVGPVISQILTTPAPISARLPATSTIEEKLSAAAMAYRNKSKDTKKEDDANESIRKPLKDACKKSDHIGIQRHKDDPNLCKEESDIKNEETNETVTSIEEHNREIIRTVIRRKEEELQQTKLKKDTERKKFIDTEIVDRTKIQESEDHWKNRNTEDRKHEEEQTEYERKIKESEMHKKIVSQDLDSADSSDSEQRLVIDNDESQSSKVTNVSYIDVKLRTEFDRLQDAQTCNNTKLQKAAQSSSSQRQDCESKSDNATTTARIDEEGETISSLLCEEEIPGSPAPIAESTEQGNSDSSCIQPKIEAQESSIVLMEMPFASAPTSGQSTASNTVATLSMAALSKPVEAPVPVSIPVQQQGPALSMRQQPQHQHLPALMPPQRRESNEAAPVMDNTPPTTPDSSISNISGSPREERTGGSSPTSEDNMKLNRECSEGDNESGSKGPGFSEDDTLPNSEGHSADKTLKPPAKRSNEDPQTLKKRKRSRKSSESGATAIPKKAGRQSGRQTRHGGGSDSDDTSEGSNLCGVNTTSHATHNTNVNNVADLSSYSSRSPRPTKYNFYVELDPELDGSQRIAVLQQKLAELRKTYNAVKVELAAIERRRKKLRRREREAMKAAKAEMQQACS